MVKAKVNEVDLELPVDIANELIRSFRKKEQKPVETKEEYYKQLFLGASDNCVSLVKDGIEVQRTGDQFTLRCYTPAANTEWFLSVTERVTKFVNHLKSHGRLVYPHIDGQDSYISITFSDSR